MNNLDRHKEVVSRKLIRSLSVPINQNLLIIRKHSSLCIDMRAPTDTLYRISQRAVVEANIVFFGGKRMTMCYGTGGYEDRKRVP